MSGYEHGSYELNEEQERYTEVPTEYNKGYQGGQEDLYVFANAMAEEWHGLKIVNDSQMLWLKELLHEMEKIIYYTVKED